MHNANMKRVDSATRIILKPPSSIYQAFMDPKALVSWLPPEGMVGELEEFQAFEGGKYKMALTYIETNYTAGKTSDNVDVVQAKFLKLIKDKQIVQQIEFESDDPSFAGKMSMSWNLRVVPGGSEVTVICENVPEGIQQDAHEEGLNSTLANLDAFLGR